MYFGRPVSARKKTPYSYLMMKKYALQCVEQGVAKPKQVCDHLVKKKHRPSTMQCRPSSPVIREKKRPQTAGLLRQQSKLWKFELDVTDNKDIFIPFVQERTRFGEMLPSQNEKETEEMFDKIIRKRSKSA